MEKANLVSGFRLRFLNEDEGQTIHKVDVRNINFQDLMRHLLRGESVLITPKLNSSDDANKQDWAKSYVTHI